MPYLLVVNQALLVAILAELIAYGKAHPGRLTYASFGIGGGGTWRASCSA